MTPDRSAVRFAGGIDEGVLGPGSSNGRPSRERMEKQIRQFVQKHGSISRSQAAELCEIEPVLAGQVLRDMRDEGLLDMVGERRGARYVAP